MASWTREDTDEILAKDGWVDGHYVLRRSKSHPGSLVVVLAHRGVARHYPMELEGTGNNRTYSIHCPGPIQRFKTAQDVIDHYSVNPDGMVCQLIKRIA